MVGPQASVPSSTRTQSTAEQEGEGRPRFFDSKAKARCWQNADVVPGRHPERWRRDPVGNVVCKRFANCYGCLCFEYDHIIPYSKGGESITENCQILQARVNRLKSDKEWVDRKELQGFSCDIKFTDKEMDVIEMAVYGDVIRPGHECRCRTVAEMLGQATCVFGLYVWCGATDPVDPGVFKSKKYRKVKGHAKVCKQMNSRQEGSVNEAHGATSIDKSLDDDITVDTRKESSSQKIEIDRNFLLVLLGWMPLPLSCDWCFPSEHAHDHRTREDGMFFCSLCEVEVGKYSKHCRVCDKCVDQFDHHCRWINNCVGRKNYRRPLELGHLMSLRERAYTRSLWQEVRSPLLVNRPSPASEGEPWRGQAEY
ncbi:hypothetical protein HPP92_026177 [Vanilla planifolia]|uniref:S-acyltransferase n=1 Tax=Vanilla planifolia TaxID=51239 RepID=A0A835PG71_VANPL|nr:hypothetical protein HPP92_026177 [Vanilla planifolia]